MWSPENVKIVFRDAAEQDRVDGVTQIRQVFESNRFEEAASALIWWSFEDGRSDPFVNIAHPDFDRFMACDRALLAVYREAQRRNGFEANFEESLSALLDFEPKTEG